MSDDFLRELEFLGVTARLKRLSDALSVSIRELYRACDVDLEPSWHLILLLLARRPQTSRHASPSEIAESLNLSQPAATKMIHRMAAKGYLEVVQETADARRKRVRLSPRGRRRMARFEQIWAAGEATIRDILHGETRFLEHLAAFEDEVANRSFATRALDHLNGDNQPVVAEGSGA